MAKGKLDQRMPGCKQFPAPGDDPAPACRARQNDWITVLQHG